MEQHSSRISDSLPISVGDLLEFSINKEVGRTVGLVLKYKEISDEYIVRIGNDDFTINRVFLETSIVDGVIGLQKACAADKTN